MKRLARAILSLLLILTVVSPVLAQASGKELAVSANRIVKEFESRYGAKVGISTQVLKSGKVPFSYNGTQPMVPASNLKVVTTAAALDVLGPDFRFETRLFGAVAKNGVINGDLVLKGGGDPTFFAPYVDSSTAPLVSMAKSLKNSGVTRIKGDLVIDDSDFDRVFIASSYHDRYLLDSYAAPVGGLGLNRNLVTIKIGPKGVTLDPPTGSIQIINKIELGSYDQVWAERRRGSDTVILQGVIRQGSTVETTLTVNDPVRLAGSTFFRILKKEGIQVDGEWKLVPEGQPASLAGKVLLARHRSPKLMEMINRTNVESDNLFAEHIFRRLGATLVGLGNVRNSRAVVVDFLKRNQVSDAGLRMADGSGLSEQNKISTHHMVGILKTMWDHPQGQQFIDSLPAPGEGTLKRRLGGVVIRAKTGTLNNHSGLSGYVVTAYGETVGFSILVNDIETTWPAVELEDRIVTLISSWDRPL